MVIADLPAYSAPARRLPPGACDCHAHVFGPFDRFPLQPERAYTPPLAPLETYLGMLRQTGFARGVVVQPSAYGTDNRCTADAVARSQGRLCAVGVVAPGVSDAALAALAAQGFRGMRFTGGVSSAGSGRFAGSVGLADLPELGMQLRAHGLHAQLFTKLDEFTAAASALLGAGVPLVLDHLGGVGPGPRTVADMAFRNLLSLVREGRVWVKLTVFRNSGLPPGYADMRPFHEALLRANPARLVWGSDWPLLNMGDRAPDIGKMVDLLCDWVSDEALVRAILVENPAVLYGGGLLPTAERRG